MICKYCGEIMDLDFVADIGFQSQSNYYACICGANVNVYEDGREEKWENEFEDEYDEEEIIIHNKYY